MKTTSYKEKYERKKYAYNSLLKDYNELVDNYNDLKEVAINSLENLKHDEQSDIYDIGFNSGVEESIAVVEDMNVPLNFEVEKPQFLLTRLEYELLKYWNEKYKYIARDKDSMLYIYKDKPSKKGDVWASIYGHYKADRYIGDLFHFISWADKEPMNIEELLNNCEVVESD